jgi:MoaA/NifB/PqqE/SkfB family radical SAM enzyme
VFTGGDPLRRRDQPELVVGATARGIGASRAPAATEELTPEILVSLRDAGIQTMSLSLDGSNAERHDGFRGVEGTFERTIRAAGWAHDAGLPLQVNTLVTDETLPDLPAVYDLMTELGILRWSLFFLISVGRGTALREMPPTRSASTPGCLNARRRHLQIKTTGRPTTARSRSRRWKPRHDARGDRGRRSGAASASATAADHVHLP